MGTEFSSVQNQEAYPPGIENHFWNKARHWIIEDTLKRVQLKEKRILDIGCGRGLTVHYLRQRGFDCYGVELSDAIIDADVQMYIKTNTEFEHLPENYRNTIHSAMLLDVIEHVSDPEEFLKKLKVALPNLKKILITVPARNELWSNYDEYYGHYMRYSLSDIKKLAKKIEANIQYQRYFFHSLYLPIFLQRFKKGRSTTIRSPKNIKLHRLAASFLYVEYNLFPKKLVGSSIIAVLNLDLGQ